MIRLQKCNLIGPCKAGVSSLSLNNSLPYYCNVVCLCYTFAARSVHQRESNIYWSATNAQALPQNYYAKDTENLKNDRR